MSSTPQKNAKLTVITGDDNPILRAKSEVITPNEYKTFIALGRDMIGWLKAKDNSAGLAAPQVGHNKRLIAINLYDEADGGFEYIRSIMMINPVILSHSEETNTNDEEGCFSVPDCYGNVCRWDSVIVEYVDETEKSKKLRFNGFNARVIQHEVDHLDGILFTDKLIKKEKIL